MAEAIASPVDVPKLAEDMRKSVWGQAHLEWASDQAFFDGNIADRIVVPAWAQNRKFMPATAYSKVVNAVAQLITSEPRARRHPLGDGKEAQERANTLSGWGAQVLRGFTRYSTTSPLKEFGKHLFLYGYACLYGPNWDNRLWPDFPKRGARRSSNQAWLNEKAQWEREVSAIFPFQVQVPHPTKVLLDPTAPAVPPWGILPTKRWAQTLKDEFPNIVRSSSHPEEIGFSHGDLRVERWEPVNVWTYWSEERYIMVVQDNITIADTENPRGYVPFIQALSGFGSDSALESNADAVASMAYGILRPIRSALVSEAQIGTGMDEMIWRWAFQHLLVERGAKTIGDAMGEFMVVETGEGNAVQWEPSPQVPNWVPGLMEDRRRDAEIGTYSQVVRGGKDPGVRTAAMHSQQVSLAKQIFNTPMQRLNHVASILLGNCARLMQVMEAPVTVTGLIEGKSRQARISPDMFQGHYAFDVDMEASDDVQRSIDMERGMALRQMAGPDGLPGAISWEHFMTRFAGAEDLHELRAELEQENAIKLAMASPLYQQGVMQRAFEIAGLSVPRQETPSAT